MLVQNAQLAAIQRYEKHLDEYTSPLKPSHILNLLKNKTKQNNSNALQFLDIIKRPILYIGIDLAKKISWFSKLRFCPVLLCLPKFQKKEGREKKGSPGKNDEEEACYFAESLTFGKRWALVRPHDTCRNRTRRQNTVIYRKTVRHDSAPATPR